MEYGLSKFKYYMNYDHDMIEGVFTNCHVYDLTNYPRTIDPRNAEKASIEGRSLNIRQEIFGVRCDKDE